MAEHGGVDGLELQAQFVGDNLSTGQDGHILQHGLATVAKARGLDGAGLEGATDVVQDQGRQCFAVDVLSDDQQRLAGLHDQLGHVHDVLLDETLPEVSRMYGSSSTAVWSSALVTKYGAM